MDDGEGARRVTHAWATDFSLSKFDGILIWTEKACLVHWESAARRLSNTLIPILSIDQ